MSPDMYSRRDSNSCHLSSLNLRASFDPAVDSFICARNSSVLIGVRDTPSTWKGCELKHPTHARSYNAGISFRFVRSPDAPKITSRQASAFGSAGTLGRYDVDA